MVNINLLPWRANVKKKQAVFFYKIMGLSVVLIMITLMMLHYGLLYKIKKQQLQVTTWQTKLSSISAQYAQCEEIQHVEQLIKKIEAGHLFSLDFFQRILSIPVPAINLSEITRKGDHIFLKGIAYSAEALTQVTALFPQGKLIEIGDISKTSHLKFILRVMQHEVFIQSE